MYGSALLRKLNSQELDRGGNLAFEFVSNFKEIARRVQGFKRHWGSHTADIIDKLATELQELEEWYVHGFYLLCPSIVDVGVFDNSISRTVRSSTQSLNHFRVILSLQ